MSSSSRRDRTRCHRPQPRSEAPRATAYRDPLIAAATVVKSVGQRFLQQTELTGKELAREIRPMEWAKKKTKTWDQDRLRHRPRQAAMRVGPDRGRTANQFVAEARAARCHHLNESLRATATVRTASCQRRPTRVIHHLSTLPSRSGSRRWTTEKGTIGIGTADHIST